MGTLQWDVRLALKDLQLGCDVEPRTNGMQLERDAPGDCLRVGAPRSNKKRAERRRQRGARPLVEGLASQGSQDAGMSDQSFIRLLSSVLRGSGTS